MLPGSGVSAPEKSRFALLEECLHALAVIFGEAGVVVVSRLDVHAVAKLSVRGAVERFPLCSGKRHGVRWPSGGLAWSLPVGGRRACNTRVDDAEPFGFFGTEALGEEVELLGLGGPDKVAEKHVPPKSPENPIRANAVVNTAPVAV